MTAESCAIRTTDNRLLECHHYWHQCLENYHDPDAFRMSLNACLHALGSVEFVLQKKKRSLTGFDAWFGPWKTRLKNDVIMKWVRSSRDKVVHEDDLETDSISRMSIVCSYDDAARKVIESLRPRSPNQVEAATRYERNLSFPPRMNKRETLKVVGSASIPKSVLDDASIVWERRWVEKHLPDWELLMAMSYAYSVLAELVQEAHALDQISHDVSVREGEYNIFVGMSDQEFKHPPCMSSTRGERSMEIDIKSEEEAGRLVFVPFALTKDGMDEALATFGSTDSYPPRDPTSALDWAQPVMDMARSIVAAGHEHQWHVMMFQGGVKRQHSHLTAETRAEKRRLAQQMAELCDASGFDGILSVGEMWGAPMTKTEDGGLVAPEDHAERMEGLMVDAASADGSTIGLLLHFERDEDRNVTFGEQSRVSEGSDFNFFAPVRAVWERWKTT